MTALRLIGIVLVVLAIVGLMSGGFRWTYRKALVTAGPVEITRQEHHAMALPPIVGIVLLVGGIILVVLPGRRRVR